MTILPLLTVLLLQGPDPLEESVAQGQSAPSEADDAVRMSFEDIRRHVSAGDYVPMSRRLAMEILAAPKSSRATPFPERSQIRSARYSAKLTATSLTEGTLHFELYEDSDVRTADPRPIGRTNLQQLRLQDDLGDIPVGSDSQQRLFLLKPGVLPRLSGTWSADGLVAGDNVTFRLKLPPATTSQFQLQTDTDVVVSAPGSLLLGPTINSGMKHWTMIPGDVSQLIIGCRRQSAALSQAPMALVSFAAIHQLNSDVLTSRWTFGLSQVQENGVMLFGTLPAGIRVTDVSLDENRSLNWQVRDLNGQQQLVIEPDPLVTTGTVTVTAVKVIPQSETWDIPMLSLRQWQSPDGSTRGSVLMPISQMSVVLPSTTQLDEWLLTGIQERDVVTRPDQSKEFQLVQFLPEASAVVRTSSSQAKLIESVVTQIEPAGRLATLRCFVLTECEGASTMQLEWPVAPGWKPIFVRNATTSKALFFESPRPAENGQRRLIVHLPEAIAPAESRIHEIQFQQTTDASLPTLEPPLQTSSTAERERSVIIYPSQASPAFGFLQRWSSGRRRLTSEQIRNDFSWFPETRLGPGVSGFESSTEAVATVSLLAADDSIRLEHTVQLLDNVLVEQSQVVIPAELLPQEPMRISLPESAGADIRWSLDGAALAVKRIDDPDTEPGWRIWQVPVSTGPADVPSVVRIEVRRALRNGESELIAMIPRPNLPHAMTGTLQLLSSSQGTLSVPELPRAPRTEASLTGESSAVLQLPDGKALVRIRVNQGLVAVRHRLITYPVFHLLQETDSGLSHRVLAVADLPRESREISLPVSLPPGIDPVVLVNGHPVRLQSSQNGFRIPLPMESEECRLILSWTETTEFSQAVTQRTLIPPLLFGSRDRFQATHHILASPSLNLSCDEARFIAGGVSSSASNASPNPDSELDQFTESGEITWPAEIRRFLMLWHFGSHEDWIRKTLVQPDGSHPIMLVRSIRYWPTFRLLIGLAAMLALVWCREWVIRQRVILASLLLILSGGLWAFREPVSTMLLYLHAGLTAGLVILMLTRWKSLARLFRRFRPRRTIAALLAFFWIGAIDSTHAQVPRFPVEQAASTTDQTLPKMIVPASPLLSRETVYIRRDVAERWNTERLRPQNEASAGVVTKVSWQILTEAADSIEVRLQMGIAAPNGQSPARVRIPLKNSRFVTCLLDGIPVIPVPDGNDAILVEIPPTILLPDAEVGPASLLAESTTVDSGPSAAFSIHTIECHLRPILEEQGTGIQFQLPAIPCPSATMEVVSSQPLFSRIRVQANEGLLQWNPSEGVRDLKNLAMSSTIEVRLFRTEIEKGSPTPALVETLVLTDVPAGLPQLTCYCRFSRWNLLLPEVRYRIPNGFDLLAVTAFRGSEVADLLWSVSNQNATIQLPPSTTNTFLLAIQLRAQGASVGSDQVIPIGELRHFADCESSENLLLAVRANPVFSVLPVEGQQVTTVAFSEIQTDWGQWVKRTDSLFRIPEINTTCTVRLTPRVSRNEIRAQHDVTLHDGDLDWKCRMDIETFVLPVFRHRVTISSDIQVTDVQVVAGEANRLSSWHRRGDQLIIQLKEGTSGLHAVTVTGKQLLQPDDLKVQLHSVQSADVLESSLTIVNQDGPGLSVENPGGARPALPLQPGEILLPGSSLRLQVIDDSIPVVLSRSMPEQPRASVAAIRSANQMTFALQMSKWSGSLGPLSLEFDESAQFLTTPTVLVGSQQLTLLREGPEFVAGADLIRTLFNQPEFTVTWTMPVPTETGRPGVARFAWPGNMDQIRWQEILLIPLDAGAAADDGSTTPLPIPAWLQTTASRILNRDLNTLQVRPLPQDPVKVLHDTFIELPVRSTPIPPEGTQDLYAVADSVIRMHTTESPSGETVLAVFASQLPSQCTLHIPDSLAVTKWTSDARFNWAEPDQTSAEVELTQPVTLIHIEWMAQSISSHLLPAHRRLRLPSIVDCDMASTLSVSAPDSIRLTVSRQTADEVSDAELDILRQANLRNGLARLGSDEQSMTAATLPSVQSLLSSLLASENTDSAAAAPNSSLFIARYQLKVPDSVVLSVYPLPRNAIVGTVLTTLLVLLVALFAKNAEVGNGNSASQIVRQLSPTGLPGTVVAPSQDIPVPVSESSELPQASSHHSAS
jgi:hypothetical protein